MYRLQSVPPLDGYNLERLEQEVIGMWGEWVFAAPNEFNGGTSINFYFIDVAEVTQNDVDILLGAHAAAVKSDGQLADDKVFDSLAILKALDLAALSAKGTLEADAIVALVKFLRIQ